MSQEQVAKAFGYKWTHDADWGMSGTTGVEMDNWFLPLLGFRSNEEYAAYFSRFKHVLDAGCGNGRETRKIATLCPNTKVTGIDVSDAVKSASEHTRHLPNVTIQQLDLTTDFAKGKMPFDCIISFGVLHHTPGTKAAFKSLVSVLAPDGEITIAVYIKKAPIREFADDYVREAIQHLTPEEAWHEMESITLLGKALSDLNVDVTIPEVKTLGLKAGTFNLQRLVYYSMFKCYWRDSFTFQENVHVNYDWYYPKFAWRHTIEEVRVWLKDFQLEELALHADQSQICVRARPNDDLAALKRQRQG
ncbi:SAM-dependent methyltransferase [Bradyrhizobium sp. i1.8.4]|uniref:class I SAM-dependent methyltransferase n=1 Tax=unclassified Bradyrhizobium TaxID=2631580 RepID=UPI003D25F325